MIGVRMMAKIAFRGTNEFMLMLSRMEANTQAIAEKAVYEAAGLVADEIRNNLEALPEDKFRMLGTGEQFMGVPRVQKQDLLDSLGIAPIGEEAPGTYGTKIGFDGYGSYATKKYPNGLPNQLLARSIESGSSVRNATPFVEPAVQGKKNEAIRKMQEIIDRECKKV